MHWLLILIFSGPTPGGAGNRQMVPGLLVLPEGNRANMNTYQQMKGNETLCIIKGKIVFNSFYVGRGFM